MKARLNGTNDAFVEITQISLADKPYVIYDANRIEFESDSIDGSNIKTTVYNIFPELRESKDERIRKAIVKIISNIDGGFSSEKIDILKVNHPNDNFKVNPMGTVSMEAMSTEELVDWLKSLKPNHWKPSEQNIKDLEWCADLVKDKMGIGFHRLQVFIDELKQL